MLINKHDSCYNARLQHHTLAQPLKTVFAFHIYELAMCIAPYPLMHGSIDTQEESENWPPWKKAEVENVSR